MIKEWRVLDNQQMKQALYDAIGDPESPEDLAGMLEFFSVIDGQSKEEKHIKELLRINRKYLILSGGKFQN